MTSSHSGSPVVATLAFWLSHLARTREWRTLKKQRRAQVLGNSSELKSCQDSAHSRVLARFHSWIVPTLAFQCFVIIFVITFVIAFGRTVTFSMYATLAFWQDGRARTRARRPFLVPIAKLSPFYGLARKTAQDGRARTRAWHQFSAWNARHARVLARRRKTAEPERERGNDSLLEVCATLAFWRWHGPGWARAPRSHLARRES